MANFRRAEDQLISSIERIVVHQMFENNENLKLFKTSHYNILTHFFEIIQNKFQPKKINNFGQAEKRLLLYLDFELTTSYNTIIKHFSYHYQQF